MKFKTLMIIKAVVCLGFAPLLLFVPGPLLKLLGASFGSGAVLLAREYGAALCGNLMLTWLALFVYDAVAFVATLIIQLSGGLNVLGWSIVVLYLFFAVGFGYLLLTPEVSS
jgi:hypothetical protein